MTDKQREEIYQEYLEKGRAICLKYQEAAEAIREKNKVNGHIIRDASVREENALQKLSPQKRDIVICAIGSKESSILSTALLMEMGCKHVIARATDKIHERILKAIGANHTINPDAEYGKRLAYKIMLQNVVSNDVSDDIQSLEINVQPFMVGKNLVELALPNKYGIIVAAIKRDNKITRPFPNERLKETDKLLLICNEEAIEKMLGDNQ